MSITLNSWPSNSCSVSLALAQWLVTGALCREMSPILTGHCSVISERVNSDITYMKRNLTRSCADASANFNDHCSVPQWSIVQVRCLPIWLAYSHIKSYYHLFKYYVLQQFFFNTFAHVIPLGFVLTHSWTTQLPKLVFFEKQKIIIGHNKLVWPGFRPWLLGSEQVKLDFREFVNSQILR